MGILFDKTIEQKRKTLIKELHDLNVTTSQDGTILEKLDFDELNYLFVLALFRKIDIENGEQRWF